MNLHEYQAKQLFAKYNLPIPNSEVVFNIEEGLLAIEKLNTDKWVVKAQVHAGGRGKAGGVKIVDNKDDLKAAMQSMLGTRLVTEQTDKEGQPVNAVLIEETCDIARELYLGAVVDRASRRVVFMASTEGGVEIEKIAEEQPDKIFRIEIDPLLNAMPYQARELAFKLKLEGKQIKQFTQLLLGLDKLFEDSDLGLLEVNPLVVTGAGDLVCLDGKLNMDDNASYRQHHLRELRDYTQEDERVNRAHDFELNYIPLDGTIGCMVNGAGLAMATMDVIKLSGGEPANFLDVGGGATKERVTEAFKIILSDKNVKGILVNIFGGIVRCDLIAEGIMAAVEEVQLQVPVVVRLEGNSAAEGLKHLNESKLNIVAAHSLSDAAEKIVKAVEATA